MVGLSSIVVGFSWFLEHDGSPGFPGFIVDMPGESCDVNVVQMLQDGVYTSGEDDVGDAIGAWSLIWAELCGMPAYLLSCYVWKVWCVNRI